MYGSDQFSVPLQRQFHVYIPQTSVVSTKPAFVRSELDGFAYRQGIAQASTTDNLNENKGEFPPSSEMRDFGTPFSSYPTLVPNAIVMVPPSVSVPVPPSATSHDSHSRQSEIHADCDGTAYEDERKNEREHRKRSKNWTRPETLRLIQARASFDTKFGRAGKKSELWDRIGDQLQKDGCSRDAQQCKDKWEKLSASYKEVQEGSRARDEFVYYEEMHVLMLARSKKREREGDDASLQGRHDVSQAQDVELDFSGDFGLRVDESLPFSGTNAEYFADARPACTACQDSGGKNGLQCMDLRAVQELMDSYLAKQRRFFAGLLDEIERREQLKERLRQEREEKWRAEEREQRQAFTNAMIILTQRLLGEAANVEHMQCTNTSDNASDEQGGFKKRLKL